MVIYRLKAIGYTLPMTLLCSSRASLMVLIPRTKSTKDELLIL